VLGLILIPALVARAEVKFDVGSIVSISYSKGERSSSPLVFNWGLQSFLSQWSLLMGVEVTDRIFVFAEVLTVNGSNIANSALTASYRIDDAGAMNVEFGKFMPPFGTYLSRRWASEDALIDFPLVYNYRTSISAFELPRSATNLLQARGTGAYLTYDYQAPSTGGNTNPNQYSYLPSEGEGLRIISRAAYQTGFQLFGEAGRFGYRAGLSNGSLSNPTDVNTNDSPNVFARLSYRPFIGMILGASFSQGGYLNDIAVTDSLAWTSKKSSDFKQRVTGFDLEFSAGHLMSWAEVIFNSWETPSIDDKLKTFSYQIEARYRFLPRVFVAARVSQISFSDIDDPEDFDDDDELREPWDNDVRQISLGFGYYVNRHMLFKVMGQANRTSWERGGDPDDDRLSVQGVVYF
jgi:hypothetical protein